MITREELVKNRHVAKSILEEKKKTLLAIEKEIEYYNGRIDTIDGFIAAIDREERDG